MGIPYKLILAIRAFQKQIGGYTSAAELGAKLASLENLRDADEEVIRRLARLALNGFDAVPIDMSTVDVPGPDYTSEIALEKMRLEEESKQLEEFLLQLTPGQRTVILERYGASGKEKGQPQLARELGISTTRVSQLERKALSLLRNKYRRAGYTSREREGQ